MGTRSLQQYSFYSYSFVLQDSIIDASEVYFSASIVHKCIHYEI